MSKPRLHYDSDGVAKPVLAVPIVGTPIVATPIVGTPIAGPPAVTAPVAAFTADDESGEAPHTVTFTDTSTGTPTSWFWEFGDGTTSTDQDPVHEYEDAGDYTVTLYASKTNGGTDSEVKVDFIEVTEPA